MNIQQRHILPPNPQSHQKKAFFQKEKREDGAEKPPPPQVLRESWLHLHRNIRRALLCLALLVLTALFIFLLSTRQPVLYLVDVVLVLIMGKCFETLQAS